MKIFAIFPVHLAVVIKFSIVLSSSNFNSCKLLEQMLVGEPVLLEVGRLEPVDGPLAERSWSVVSWPEHAGFSL